MLKRELKINGKSFMIWTSILVLLFLLVALIYPSIMNHDNIQMMDEFMKLFPEEILKAFNMDISSIDSFYGWLKTEGFVFVLLITGVYASILGSHLLVKEEDDKTIEYLNSLPITRNHILSSKIVCGTIYIVLMVVMVGIFNYILLRLSGDFNEKQYLLLSITPLFSSLPLFVLNLFLSTFTHKTKKMLGISLGIVFISYFLQILSEINEVTEFLKYFTVYTLADIRHVITNVELQVSFVVISLLITLLFGIGTYIRYNKKELV